MPSSSTIDRAAIALSFACVAHCVALPVIAIAAPLLSTTAEAEWVHWLLTALAIGASAIVMAKAHSGREPSFLVPALSGIGLMLAALFAEHWGLNETILTLSGGLLMAAAHIFRLIRHT